MSAAWCFLAMLFFTQTGKADADSDLVKRWLAVCQAQAELYSLGPMNADLPRFQRLKDPIFRHATPARGNDIGAVYLWVDAEQRPMVVSDIFAWSFNNEPKRQIVHECHSLAGEPLRVLLDGQPKWKPQRAGLKWELLTEAPVPATIKSQRSRQARELAQKFSASSTDANGGRWELRVLPQPVYQYEAQGTAGAMFAVCQGTDPELWLLLEARPTQEGPRWFYACATFTDYALNVQYNGSDIWSCPKYQHGVNNEPHWCEGVVSNVIAPELPK